MKLRPYGDRGVLLAELGETIRSAWLAQLDQELPIGCSEYVVGYDSILLLGESAKLRSEVKLIASKLVMPVKDQKARNCHDIEVEYSGADLEEVAQACGMEIEEVIHIHSAPTYTVHMIGFSPGFPYLDGLDSRLHLERHPTPRKRIEPGAVAIGGRHAGIYSVASPGGWHLLGHTDHTLFNLKAAEHAQPLASDVFALAVGDRVRFHPQAVC